MDGEGERESRKRKREAGERYENRCRRFFAVLRNRTLRNLLEFGSQRTERLEYEVSAHTCAGEKNADATRVRPGSADVCCISRVRP